MKGHCLKAGLMAGATWMLCSAPALAQDTGVQNAAPGAPANPLPAPAAPPSDGTPAEIVVTAQKRVERLQDVPLAVTAVSGDTLVNRQINDTANLVQAVPSLSFQQGNNPTNTTFRVRGIGTSLFSQGVESAVSVVVDGVVAARQAQNFSDFADIERVEVLRGPQGTLFGKNATAGVINVVTARPSRDFEARGNITVAERDEYRGSGTVSGPLTSTLRARLSGYYNSVAGHQDNVALDWRDGGFKSWGVRGKLDWDATDRLNLMVAADYRENKANCCTQILVSVGNPLRNQVIGNARVAADTRDAFNNGLTYADAKQVTAQLNATYDLDVVNLTSVTAYQAFDLVNNFEVDRLGAVQPIFIATPSNAQLNLNRGVTKPKQFSQELRVDSAGNGPITFTVGGYYSHLSLERDFTRRRATCVSGTFAQPCVTANTRYSSLGSEAMLKNEHIAGFSQVEAKIVGGLKLLGGLRVQKESISVEGAQTGVLVAGDALFGSVLPPGKTSASDTAVTGKAGAKYEFSRRAQIYATYTRGYKGLGLDTEITANFANNPIINPEHVNAYEVGFKGSTPGGVLTVAMAAFLADYTNLQIQANRSDPITGVSLFQTVNAGKSQTKGFEIEATVRPARGFSIGGALTYQKPTIDVDGLNCPTAAQASPPVIAVGGATPINSCYRVQTLSSTGALVTSGPRQDVRGVDLPASPHWRVNLSPRWEGVLVGRLAAFAEVDLSYQSSQQFAVEQDPLTIQKGYTLVDASIGVKTADSRYSLTLFVKNMFDKNFYTTSVTAALIPTNLAAVDVFAFRPKNADRYLGATFGFRF